MFAKLLVVSALASAAFATECTRTYTVKEGDWCDTISQAHNVSTYQLSMVNADKINDACTNLEIGQELCLGTKDQDCTITHNVAYGDTCDKIMQGAAINATMLYANNPQIDEYCSNIYIGEVLCVAGAYAAPEPVPDRQVATSGEPAGPPASVPYPEAKPTAQSTPTPGSSTANHTPASTDNEPAATPTPAPENTQSTTPETDDENDDDLPECEDPNDDGY